MVLEKLLLPKHIEPMTIEIVLPMYLSKRRGVSLFTLTVRHPLSWVRWNLE